jgi:fructokinase
VIAVVGEALIDLVEAEPSVYRAIPGGAPANVAIGLARLGIPTAFVGRIGRDTFSQLSRRRLERDGVNLEHSIAAKEASSVAVVSFGPDGVPDYSFYLNGTADGQFTEEELAPAAGVEFEAVHVGSVAHTLAPGAAAIRAFTERVAQQDHTLVSYDPNVRPSLGGDPIVERERTEWFVQRSDVIKVSDEDLAWLYPEADPLAVANKWVSGSNRLVVVTSGSAGALACAGWLKGEVTVPGRAIDLVDTVGAGDSFCAALLAELTSRLAGGRPAALSDMGKTELWDVLRVANIAASLACQRSGAQPPTRAELDHALAATP